MGRLLQILIYTSVSIVAALTIVRSRRVEVALRGTLAEQRQAQSALETSEKRFRALIEHSWDAVALFSADGKVLYGSPATTRVLGYELENFIGRSAFEFIHPDVHPFAIGRIQSALEQPGANVDLHLLTVVIGHVEMAMMPLAPAVRVGGDLEEIRKAARRGGPRRNTSQ